jgi:hypothetical protein
VNDAGSDRGEIFTVSFRADAVVGDHTNLAESVTNSMTRDERFARRASRTKDRTVKMGVTIFR